MIDGTGRSRMVKQLMRPHERRISAVHPVFPEDESIGSPSLLSLPGHQYLMTSSLRMAFPIGWRVGDRRGERQVGEDCGVCEFNPRETASSNFLTIRQGQNHHHRLCHRGGLFHMPPSPVPSIHSSPLKNLRFLDTVSLDEFFDHTAVAF